MEATFLYQFSAHPTAHIPTWSTSCLDSKLQLAKLRSTNQWTCCLTNYNARELSIHQSESIYALSEIPRAYTIPLFPRAVQWSTSKNTNSYTSNFHATPTSVCFDRETRVQSPMTISTTTSRVRTLLRSSWCWTRTHLGCHKSCHPPNKHYARSEPSDSTSLVRPPVKVRTICHDDWQIYTESQCVHCLSFQAWYIRRCIL